VECPEIICRWILGKQPQRASSTPPDLLSPTLTLYEQAIVGNLPTIDWFSQWQNSHAVFQRISTIAAALARSFPRQTDQLTASLLLR
jgi:hypothetical protein